MEETMKGAVLPGNCTAELKEFTIPQLESFTFQTRQVFEHLAGLVESGTSGIVT